MDLQTAVESISREVMAGEREGRPTRTVLASREYAAGIDDVWDALTNPERLPRWFMPVSGELHVGGRYQFEGNAGGEVLACEKPSRAQLTWEFGGEISWLELTLTDLGDRTRVGLEHIAPVTAHMSKYGPGAIGVGWDFSFLGLANHLAGGPDVRPGDEDELIGTPEGRAFVETSSERWADASIAAGDDPDAARAAQQATTAFYTGDQPGTG
jgi:uncharacterized protein YndB with AHSA1/START domain